MLIEKQQQTQINNIPVVTNGQLNENTSSSASSSCSASSVGRHHPEYLQQQQHLINNPSASSSEIQQLIQQSILFGQQQQTPSLPQPATTPFSLASLNYGPFGLPSFSISPQAQSLLQFPPQLQQHEIEQQYNSAINSGLISTQNAYEGLPIFVMPNTGTLSLNAIQRAAEFKAIALNAILQQQQTKQLTSLKIHTSKHFHVFVGDLSQDVDNQILYDAFSKFGHVSEAKVMINPQSTALCSFVRGRFRQRTISSEVDFVRGLFRQSPLTKLPDTQSTKSRSFGFVAFPSKEDAQKAIKEMNGVQLGRRAIRTGWAVGRSNNTSEQIGSKNGLSEDEKEEFPNSSLTFESIYNSTEADNTTIYLGGLSSLTTEEPIRLAFNEFGLIKEIRLFASQNFGFVVFSDKKSATKAILEMNGKEINFGIVAGKCKIKVKWGKPIQSNCNGNDSTTNKKTEAICNNNLTSLALNQQNVAAALISQQQQQLALAALLQQTKQPPLFQSPMLQQTQQQQLFAQLIQQQQQQNLQGANSFNNNCFASSWPQTQQF